MSDLVDKVKGFADNKLNQKAQPGDGVERSADSGVNPKLDNIAGNLGLPQQDDSTLNNVADAKVNSDIPFGNN